MSAGSKKSARPQGGGKVRPRLEIAPETTVLWTRPYEITSLPYSSKKLHMFRPVVVGHQLETVERSLKRVYTKSLGLWCPHANKLRYPRGGCQILLKAVDSIGKLPHQEGSKIFFKAMSVELGTRRRPAHAIRHARMQSFRCQSRFSHLKLELVCLKV